MLEYILPFLSNIFVEPFFGLLTGDVYLSYFMGVLITFVIFLFFVKKYSFRFRFNPYSLLVGFLVFVVWVLVPTRFYPVEFAPPTYIFLFAKFFGSVFLVPFVEELFFRSFLVRFFVNRNWERVKVGTFSWLSFVVTVLFFGFSSNAWLAGLIIGVILNLWLYRTKSVEQCIVAHSFANFLLFFFALYTNSFSIW